MNQDSVGQYQVIGADGQIYPPVDPSVLKLWAADGRLSRDMMIIDVLTGLHMRAEDMLAAHDVFPSRVPPVSLPQSSGEQRAAFAGGQLLTSPIGTVPALTPAPLLSRLIAFIIDIVCSLPLVFASSIPFVGIIFAPLLCLYWLSRDAFGGQSIGKRVLGLRAVREDGTPFTWASSASRNIIYLTMLVLMIPILGVTLVPFCVGLPGLIDIVLVLTTSKRIGDYLGHSLVVAAK